MKRLALVLAVLPILAAAQEVERRTVRNGGVEVPVEFVRPPGTGPFPPLLYVHARRGYEEEDRTHARELARDGFLVAAPDWQSGRLIDRWPVPHDPATEGDVEAALDALLQRADACKGPVGIVGISRGPYYALRLAAKRPRDVAAIVSYYGHFQNPNAAEPLQIYSIAPEVQQISAPVLMLIGEQDFEVRRLSNARAFYALWERGVPVELQMYPMARRAFDFRRDASPEEKIATRHARQRAREWLIRHMKLTAGARCP